MSGPNRERKHGDQGPDYHVESRRTTRHMQLWDRPRAAQPVAWGVNSASTPLQNERLRQPGLILESA